MLLAEHGGLSGLRGGALLESALNRPRQRFLHDQDASLFLLASLYAHGLAGSHPFVDGNKRIAPAVAALFLELNGWMLNAGEAEVVVVFDRLASGGGLSQSDLFRWLEGNSRIMAE